MFGVGGVWGWQFFIFCRAFKQTQPGVVHLLLLESLTDYKALMPFSSTAYQGTYRVHTTGEGLLLCVVLMAKAQLSLLLLLWLVLAKSYFQLH